MKRERAVWNDEEDEIIASRPKVTNKYGAKVNGQEYNQSLRTQFQYVTIYPYFLIYSLDRYMAARSGLHPNRMISWLTTNPTSKPFLHLPV